jgi:hypothetical protein
VTRMIPERPTRRQAWKAIKKVCTLNPQRDEVYAVKGNPIIDLEAFGDTRTIGELERWERLWIMRRSICGSFQFKCYGHYEIRMVRGRVKVTPLHEGKEHVCHKPRWDGLKRAGRVRFLGFLCTYRKEDRDT